MTRKRLHGGGAATAAGMDFQHRSTAWVAVRILAESDTSPPWGLAAGTTIDWLRCETEEPVDDLLVGTSGDGFVFLQAKRTLHLSKAPGSELASALDQFVRQFLAHRAGSAGARPWQRPLDAARDRLVLITRPTSSTPIRVQLPAVLGRVRGFVPGQPLEDAAVNREEGRTLAFVRDHLRRSWQVALGAPPSDDQICQLISLVHVHILDVEDGGAAELEAKDRLRTSVLWNPEQADAAWDLLIAGCARFAAERSGADRVALQQILLDAGIQIRAARSYREDIERLMDHSRRTAGALADLARIRVGATQIKIQRRSTEELRRAAEEGSIVVVGEPGAGKSGALHDLVQLLWEEERDVVFLAVDRLAARSRGELRQELGLEYELEKVLPNWPGGIPGFLVIDALDAARADPAARTIRDLIRIVAESAGRWHVVASIRKFDLRYSPELRQLFRGEPPTRFLDEEFVRIRHLNVPLFSEEELAEIQSQSAALQALIANAPRQLQDLLGVPFNLRLMAELLGVGVELYELTPVRTQLGLLHQYWIHRIVRGDAQGDAREAVLRRACEGMVETRTLRFDRSRLADPSASGALTDLLSVQILTEWQPSPTGAPERYVVTFSHHVLFDYAVARLLLRGTPETLADRLRADPELVLVVRPSLVLHFRYLWTVDDSRAQFWGLVFRVVQTPGIPEIGKLIGPSAAAELTANLSDLESLCASTESADPAFRDAAEQALRHLVGSLLAAPPGPLLGPGAGPWCDLLERISRDLRAPVAYTVRSLLSTLCAQPEAFTPEQRAAAGITARRLLQFAWTHTPRERWLVIHSLEAVCRTFESDPAASATLLRRSLESSHLVEHGFEEMPWLAREVKRLITLDTRLVQEIYRAAFAHRESSTEVTPIGESRILPMSSNRQQDYHMAVFELAQVFPKFLAHAPRRAAGALIHVMEAYVAHDHPAASRDVVEETFDFSGREARIRTDFSAIWDAGNTYSHDEPLKMLDAFERHLERLAERENDSGELRELVQILVAENRLAVLWRRLLLLGARFPRTLGREIQPLAQAMPILTGYDTTTPAGEFLREVFPVLAPPDRERIECVVLSIPDALPADRREVGEKIRNRLLGCLSDAHLVTGEAGQLLADLRAANAVPPNEPPLRFTGWTKSPYGEEQYLADEGVPIEEEANRRIRDLERPVKEFEDRHLNSVPPPEEIAVVLPVLQELWTALSRADVDGVHPKQRDYAWGHLAGVCSRIARTEGLSCEDTAGAFIRTVLLDASRHTEPTYHPEQDAQFDEHPSWGSPAARIEAAEGLIMLARHSTCATTEVIQAIEWLTNDPVPAVRYQVAARINTLYRTAPELMWQIVERLCREERSRGVLQGLLTGPLGRLAGAHTDRVTGLTRTIFDRVREGPGAKTVREFCVGIFAGLYIWHNHAQCGEVILHIATNPTAYPDEAPHLLAHLREPLTHGPTHPGDPAQDAVRHRTLDLLDRILRSARDGLREVEQRHSRVRFNDWPPQDRESAKSLARLVDHVGMEVYFASGAYDRKGQAQAEEDQPVTREWAERFYREAGPILDELADVGLPSVTHHLLETLEFFISLDPRGVFLRIGHVVRGGEKGGYQYESLAADLMVRLVERYLAEYRALLRDDEDCRRTLLEVLDIFVRAGWPSARRLTYRLEEIFR